MNRDELISHYGRPIITYIVPSEYTSGQVDILLIDDLAILINPLRQKVVLIKNYAILETIKKLIQAAQKDGYKIDLNKFIDNILKNKFPN